MNDPATSDAVLGSAPTRFYDRTTAREMALVHFGPWAGWLVWRHPEGHWVSFRRATGEDVAALERAAAAAGAACTHPVTHWRIDPDDAYVGPTVEVCDACGMSRSHWERGESPWARVDTSGMERADALRKND